MDDWQLLQDYATRGSEAAFRALTDRHLKLVHSVALRQVSDTQLAEEICQAVFILLARKAGSLSPGTVLAGWLFRTTRFVAARARRGEQRRQRREQEALEMQLLTALDQTQPRFASVLDDALAQLGETDRNALLLRFFEDKNHKEIGVALGLEEEAARKRVGRAIEKLRSFFAKRGFTLSAAVLASALAADAAKAAPAALASTVAASACAAGSAASGSLPALVREVLNAWRRAKIKLAGSLAAGLVVVVGLAVFLARSHNPAAPVLPSQTRNPQPAMAVSTKSTKPVLSARQAAPTKKSTGQVLRFHVVAKNTGEVAANAQLAVNTVGGFGWQQRYDLATDQTGTAQVPCPPGTGRLDVGVVSWGWGARFATWFPAREDPIPAEYTMQVERVTNTMGGWLRDAQGRPVVNAEIVATFSGTSDYGNVESPRERFGCLGGPVVARSDARGWWTCAIIPPNVNEGFELKAKHPGFRPVRIIDAQTVGLVNATNEAWLSLLAGRLVTRLEAGPILMGHVFDESGRQIANVRIVHGPDEFDPLSAQTDADGSFAMANIEGSNFDFTVSAPGFAPTYEQVKVHEVMEPVEIRLKPGAMLRLRVLDKDGEAVPGATVSLRRWGSLEGKIEWRGESDAGGRIEWDSAPIEGDLGFWATKTDWRDLNGIQFRADGQEHVITMQRAFGVSGYVTDSLTGQPIPEFKVFPGYEGGVFSWDRSQTRHGTNGQFTVHLEPPLTFPNAFVDDPGDTSRFPWRVRVEAEGYAPFVSDPVLPNFTNRLDVAMERLDPTKSIRGTVWRPDRRPAVGAEVALITFEHSASLRPPRLRRDPGENLIATTTDAEGRFSFSPDSKAHTVIAVSADGFARVRVRDPRQPLTVMLEPWGRIEGVVDASVSVLPIESVLLSSLDGDPNGGLNLSFDPVRPDKSGRFVFEMVPPEALCLSVNPGNGKLYHHRTLVRVTSALTTTVVITNTGWWVRGRFTLASGQDANRLKQVTAELHNEAPLVTPPVELSGDAARLWLVDFWDSDAGRQKSITEVRVVFNPAADGSFETDETFPPGEYRLRVYDSGEMKIDRVINLTAPGEGISGEYDLGAIAIPEHSQE